MVQNNNLLSTRRASRLGALFDMVGPSSMRPRRFPRIGGADYVSVCDWPDVFHWRHHRAVGDSDSDGTLIIAEVDGMEDSYLLGKGELSRARDSG